VTQGSTRLCRVIGRLSDRKVNLVTAPVADRKGSSCNKCTSYSLNPRENIACSCSTSMRACAVMRPWSGCCWRTAKVAVGLRVGVSCLPQEGRPPQEVPRTGTAADRADERMVTLPFRRLYLV
jgi:hypothetical protein